MNMHSRWLAILISLVGGFAIFSNAMAAGENIPITKSITQIRTLTTYATVNFDPPFVNSLGCSSGVADKRAAIDWGNKPDKKVMFATAMLAFATNKKVGFFINGCHASGVPIVVRISLED